MKTAPFYAAEREQRMDTDAVAVVDQLRAAYGELYPGSARRIRARLAEAELTGPKGKPPPRSGPVIHLSCFTCGRRRKRRWQAAPPGTPRQLNEPLAVGPGSLPSTRARARLSAFPATDNDKRTRP